MFDIRYANKKEWRKKKKIPKIASNIDRKDISRASLINWAEHCIECTAPLCYKTCPLYKKRKDGQCSRFVYGIIRNKAFRGRFNFGADITFRRWGKLEANLTQTSALTHKLSHRASLGILFVTRLLNKALQMISIDFMERFLESKKMDKADEFLIECYSPEKEPFKLIFEQVNIYKDKKKIIFRKSFAIKKGMNTFSMELSSFDFSRKYEKTCIYFYPEEKKNKERRLIFTWLDFVKYKHQKKKAKKSRKPAEKVKCVAWDLDNTLWNATLVNSDPKKLKLREGVLQLIKDLDKRGIIQTIISKNTFEDAWEVIKRLKLEKYFIYPVINWGQKSNNLQTIAKKININIDTFCLIDDSIFEREEVKSALPEVRVYTEKEIDKLLTYKEFDVPITSLSKKRRLSYLSKVKRDKAESSFSGEYDAFLKECKMELNIFIPQKEKEKNRCWELLQRSNQLNLSTKRYEKEEFSQLLENKNILSLAFSCKDKFGDYGIIGFCSIDTTDIPTMKDFVLSCRVAQKYVEQTFFLWLANLLKKQKYTKLKAELTKTDRNGPLIKVFEDLPFKKEKAVKQRELYILDLTKTYTDKKIIRIQENVK